MHPAAVSCHSKPFNHLRHGFRTQGIRKRSILRRVAPVLITQSLLALVLHEKGEAELQYLLLCGQLRMCLLYPKKKLHERLSAATIIRESFGADEAVSLLG